MNPGPSKRPRGSSSPRSPRSPEPTEREREEKRQRSSDDPSARHIPRPNSLSPTRTILPPPTPSKGGQPPSTFPHPSTLVGGAPPPLAQQPAASSSSADPSSSAAPGQEPRSSTGWSSNWPGPSRRRDARSDSEPRSNRSDEEEAPSTETIVFSRDHNSRAPRSMMACARCRKQKMKCDGPSVNPCRGCKQAGVPCRFEHRNRPKSISVLPSRAPPLFATFPAASGTPSKAQGPPGFYPSAGQPAPPTLSRAPLGEPYAIRPPHESGHHRGSQSVSAIGASYSIASAASSTRMLTSPTSRPPSSHVPVAQPPPSIHAPPPFAMASASRPIGSPTLETRLRAVEGGLQNLASVPATLTSLQQAIKGLQNVVESLGDRVAPAVGENAPVATEFSPAVWEDYRSRAWPLTPWLAGLRDSPGLTHLVVAYLGKLAATDTSEASQGELYHADKAIRTEIARLVSLQAAWSKDDIQALSAYATWTSDTTLSALAVARGRKAGLSTLWSGRNRLDKWRDWVYLVIMDHLNQILDALPPTTADSLAVEWKDSLLDARPHVDPRIRERDNRLLAWLDYAELLADVQQRQRALRRLVFRDEAPVGDSRASSGLAQLWAQNGPLWDQWASAVSARDDPILNIHFHYAVLFTTSPLFFARESVWDAMAAEPEGKAVLERARDAAFAVTQAICSTEIGRTLIYSYTFYRPILALALITLVNIKSISSSSTPLVNPTHVVDLLRTTYEGIAAVKPVGFQAGGMIAGRLSLVSGEPGRDLWRLFLG